MEGLRSLASDGAMWSRTPLCAAKCCCDVPRDVGACCAASLVGSGALSSPTFCVLAVALSELIISTRY
eukprot:scaffold118193_cov35-Tisochrysis_lutea.AAC.3